MQNYNDAINFLNPTSWKNTSLEEKLKILIKIKENIIKYKFELINEDLKVKKLDINSKNDLHDIGTAIQSTIYPIASNISACISLYKSLIRNKKLPSNFVNKISEEKWDVKAFPLNLYDKFLYFDRTDYLRVTNIPNQICPNDLPGGIIAIIGAGNFSSALEIVKSIFIENYVAVFKPHPLNAEVDKVWQKVFEPLISSMALSFCHHDSGKELVTNTKLKKIYFTGGHNTATSIKNNSKAELIAECGGNNPLIIIPGIKKWTKRQLIHHANHIATFAKINGGAACARPQTIITQKNWNQREEFIEQLKKAITQSTPAMKSYYPEFQKSFETHQKMSEKFEIFYPENKRLDEYKFLFLENISTNSFSIKNEAFCQVLCEHSLDIGSDIKNFIKSAQDFANKNIWGSLSATIIVDDSTHKHYKEDINSLIENLNYGSVTVNTMPLYVWLNPNLTWGGNDQTQVIESGKGNFGNALCIQNVEKSIIKTPFISLSHLSVVNKKNWYKISIAAIDYSINPNLKNALRLGFRVMINNFLRKDF